MKTAGESLTVLLLVRNAQNTLARDIERLVETASELTSRFEVVIIDDGSTDATEEIAWELSARHDQVELIRQPRPLGAMAALRAGLAATTGQYVLLGDHAAAPADEALSALWRQRHQESSGPHSWRQSPTGTGWLERLVRQLRGRGTSSNSSDNTRGWRLLRRAEMADMAPATAGTGRTYLDRRNAPRAPLTGTADRAESSWHNAMS